MDSVQQVWYWRCRGTQAYTNVSMPQSGSESPVRSGRAAKQRPCASDQFGDNVTAQQLGKNQQQRGFPRTPWPPGLYWVFVRWRLLMAYCWGTGSWLVVRTSRIASPAVSFINCHLNLPPHSRKVSEGNLFRGRSVEQVYDFHQANCPFYAQLCLKICLAIWRKQ